MFMLFLRFFVWKTYSEGSYWKKRPKLSLTKVQDAAKQQGEKLPFFSILVPARNEADVIEKTVRHMAGLQYPNDRYEVIVVTDAKERQQNVENQEHYVLDTAQFLDYAIKGEWDGAVKPHVESMTLGLLSGLCLDEYRRPKSDVEPWLLQPSIMKESRTAAGQLLFDLSGEIISRNGRISLNQIYRLFRRFYPALSDQEIERIFPGYLCLAVPVCQLYARMTGNEHSDLMRNVITQAAKANNRITREIVSKLSAMVGQQVSEKLLKLQAADQIKPSLRDIYGFCFPTTQRIVERIQMEWSDKRDLPTLKHVEVPVDFDGKFGGKLLGRSVPSTKGRALNYALPVAVDVRTVMCGFYDAESRPDTNVLLYVAWKRLTDKIPVRIFQGPVFQVRNWYEMGPFSKIASLYQAVSHDWYLPVVFKRLPFVGGTNLFIEKQLLEEIGGYDHESLTEDLELGTRAYLKAGAWPEYLPYPSSEQTPTVYKAFYRQRLRWGTGHLQVMDKLARDQEFPEERKRPLMRELWIKGPVEWTFYQFATLVPPTILILWWLGQVDPNVLPDTVRYILNGLSVIYISFTFYAFFRYRKHVDTAGRPLTLPGRAFVVAQLLALPLAAFFFPVPFTSALVLKGLRRSPTGWTKTPRSKE